MLVMQLTAKEADFLFFDNPALLVGLTKVARPILRIFDESFVLTFELVRKLIIHFLIKILDCLVHAAILNTFKRHRSGLLVKVFDHDQL